MIQLAKLLLAIVPFLRVSDFFSEANQTGLCERARARFFGYSNVLVEGNWKDECAHSDWDDHSAASPPVTARSLKSGSPSDEISTLQHATWLRDYGERFITATMILYRNTLTKKVIAVGNIKCGFVLMLALRAREAHREAQSRG